MDEEKDKDVCLGSVSESTTVNVREHVAGETQVEGSLSVGVERVEDGGGCNGDDIMVEVLGSDVYVDGVCTHGEGGRGGLAEDEIGGSGDGKSVEGDGKSLVRNGGRSALSLRGIGVSGGEASNLQSKTGVDCSLGMVESPGKQARVVKAEKVEVTMREGGSIGERLVGGEGQKETVGTGRRNDDLTRQDVTCLDGEALNTAIGAGDGGSLAVTVSMCVETHDVHVEEVVVVAGEAVLEKEMVEVGAERGREVIGGGSDGIEGTNTKEVVVFDDKEKTTRLENGVGDSSVVVGSLGVETQVVKEVGMTETVEGLESGLIVDGAEDGRELAYVGLDVANNLSKQEVGVGDEVWNPGIDSKAASTELVVEKSSLQAQDYKEKVPVVVTEEMNPKIVTSGSCALEGVVCNSGRGQSSITEPTFGGTKKDAASSKSLDEESKAAATGEVAEIDEGGTLCSKLGGVESDAIDGNTTCSMEKQLEKVDKFGDSFENHSDVSSNPVSSCPPNQGVVGGDNTVMDDKGPLNSESDQHFNHEEGLDKIIAHDPALMEVDEQVIDAESVCLHGGGIEGIEEQSVKVETTCVSTVSQSNVSADLMSNQVVVGGEAAAAKDDKVFSDANAVVPETTAKARKSDCSENDQKLKAETVCGSIQGDAQVTDERETALMDCEAILDSNCEVPGAAEKNQLLESEMCLEKGMAGDLFIDSNIGQETEVKRQVVNAECADATSSHQPTEVVAEAEVAAVEGNFLLNPNVETDTQVIVRAEIVPGGIEVLNSNMDIPGSVEFEECIEKSLAGDFAHLDAKCGSQVKFGGQETIGEQVDLHGEQEMEVEDNIADTELSKADEEKFVERADLNSGSVVKVYQARYLLPSENEGEFSISDLVWGKVRSHPWWPGQIFDPADSSEKAMKHHKKDCFLVAYFGDRTFAWNEASQLKPFQTHFSHEEKQSNSEAFQNAVECALEEVSRRVELGLACSCIPQDAYDKIQFQIVENTGIQEEASKRRGVVRTANSSYFEPDKLMEYMKALARFPSGGSDQLELVIAKAQLLSFYRLKGYCSLPDLQFCGQLLESDTDTVVSEDRIHSSEVFEHATALYKDDELTSSKQEISKGQNSSFNKRKHNLKDDVLCKKKERSLSELMGDSADGDNWSDGKTAGNLVSLASGKKRKTVEYHDDHGPQDGRKTISFAKVSNTTPSSFPKPSFKIGDCIRRVASQLTGSHSILKCNSERFQKLDGSNEVPAGDEADFSFLDSEDAETERMIDTTDYSSLDDLLSQLLVAAQDPLKGNSFSNIIASFFSDFRNSVLVGQPSDREFLALDKVGRRKRSAHSVGGPPETFEFEDMSDTYWTDRVIQNGSEEQPPRKNRKREYQIVPVVLEKPLHVSRRPYSRKRYSDGNQVVADDKPAGYIDDNSPAEIVMNFSEVRSVPSETNLNKMFRHFGPLKESETEVDRDTSRARVVFKKSSDAEVAFNSAGRFKIFGPTLVNYQINYTPCALFKASPMDIAQDHEMQLDLAALEVDLV